MWRREPWIAGLFASYMVVFASAVAAQDTSLHEVSPTFSAFKQICLKTEGVPAKVTEAALEQGLSRQPTADGKDNLWYLRGVRGHYTVVSGEMFVGTANHLYLCEVVSGGPDLHVSEDAAAWGAANGETINSKGGYMLPDQSGAFTISAGPKSSILALLARAKQP